MSTENENVAVSDQTALSVDNEKTTPKSDPPQSTKKDFRFWAILVVLALASLLTSLEATITSTVLPMITTDLSAGDSYIWIANAYFLTLLDTTLSKRLKKRTNRQSGQGHSPCLDNWPTCSVVDGL
jgi:hypothetical protein